MKQGLRHLLENLLEDEVTSKVKARRYERSPHRRSDVDVAIGRLFLQGISTRRLKSIARELFG